jgi:hypothetical protein
MLVLRRQLMSLRSFALLGFVSIGPGFGWALAQNIDKGPPIEQVINIDLPPAAACTFGVNILGQGKAKLITLPGDRSVLTSPGLNVTVTNVNDSSKQLRNINVTGATHTTTKADGSQVLVYTGRNLNFDPVAGFVLAIGRFSIVVDADGKITQSLQGNGKLIDVCELLE